MSERVISILSVRLNGHFPGGSGLAVAILITAADFWRDDAYLILVKSRMLPECSN